MRPSGEAGNPVAGAGLGLRREFIDEFVERVPTSVAFVEVAPENWIRADRHQTRLLAKAREHVPLVAHGLSLSIGSPAPLDTDLIDAIRVFLREYDVRCYTEHLSFCSDFGQLYELLPIPFTDEAVNYVASRIRQVQDLLGERIGIENVSYYAAPGQQLSESQFINAIVAEADCGLLLDVNNIFVNATNHNYDAGSFLSDLPGERIMYAHVAGHYDYDETGDLKIDSHGTDVVEPVWSLLETAYRQFGVFPTLLERDFDIPPLHQLLSEVDRIRSIQKRTGTAHADSA